MNLLRVAAAALNQTPLDWNGNRRRIVEAMSAARESGVSVLCLPELCISGYGCEDMFHSPAVARTANAVLQEMVPETADLIVSLGLPIYFEGAMYNAAVLAVDGRVAGLVAKQNLAGEGVHYEPRWFRPWRRGRVEEVESGGAKVPLGDLIFDVGGVRLGFEICEDAWVAQRPGSFLAAESLDVILNPSASHFAFGKQEIRRRFVLEGSRAFGVAYVYANQLGNESGRMIYDGGTMIAAGGKLLAMGPRFSFRDALITAAEVDLDTIRMSRVRTGRFHDGELPPELPTVHVDFAPPQAEPALPLVREPDWESGDSVKEEEFTRAVSLGLYDYLRKSRSRGFVVSVSGGADSTAVAMLCSLAVRLGAAEIGLDEWKQKLAYLGILEDAQDERAIVERLLTCAYQATRNSSDTTREAARTIVAAAGGKFLHLDIDELVQSYTEKIGAALGRELTWERDDIALQNIQARVRAPSIWMLANVTGALLLSTSNRSEAAVGYATMDGDTAGGLCPIAGIDKAFLRHWLRWMEKVGPQSLSPVPELSAVNRLEPTAELRPQDQAQTDEGDLMPYDLLDYVERAAIRDKQLPLDVFHLAAGRFPQYTAAQLVTWIERFFKLWCRNQWKRERYAPSFHLDDENLDPKTWCRFPILSGGFERELAELREFVGSGL